MPQEVGVPGKEQQTNEKLKKKMDSIHKFESNERAIKSPHKTILKSKEEGQILGLPQEEKKEEKEEDYDEEPSIYFYEDDEEELEKLVTKWLPILEELTRQINEFDVYNGMKEFKKEHHYDHTLIMDNAQHKRSSIGVKKAAKRSSATTKNLHDAQSHKVYHSHVNHKELAQMQETVTGMLGIKRYDDWILNLNIGNVMHLSPLGLQEMNLQLDNSHELTRDAILEKIVLLSIAYFWVGTELRFLSQNKSKNQEKQDKPKSEEEKIGKKESEKWQAKAVQTSCTFLPSECPLVGHVIASYQKHHSIINQPIPEDEELDDDLMFIRPLNEIKQDSINYHQIVKNHVPAIRRLPPRMKSSTNNMQHFKGSHMYEGIQELSKSIEDKMPVPSKQVNLSEHNKGTIKPHGKHEANRFDNLIFTNSLKYP